MSKKVKIYSCKDCMIEDLGNGTPEQIREAANQLLQQALDDGYDPKEILNNGLIDGMSIVGGRFKREEIYVPNVMISARAMSKGLAILEPKLAEAGNEPVGKVVIGTIRGVLHDIGRNLTAMMYKGAGFEVCDMGVDVPAEAFIDKAEEISADICHGWGSASYG